MPEPRLLTVEEAAAAIHATVSTRAVYAMIRDGTLAAVRIGLGLSLTKTAPQCQAVVFVCAWCRTGPARSR